MMTEWIKARRQSVVLAYISANSGKPSKTTTDTETVTTITLGRRGRIPEPLVLIYRW